MQLVNQESSSDRARLSICIAILCDSGDNTLAEFIQIKYSLRHTHTHLAHKVLRKIGEVVRTRNEFCTQRICQGVRTVTILTE